MTKFSLFDSPAAHVPVKIFQVPDFDLDLSVVSAGVFLNAKSKNFRRFITVLASRMQRQASRECDSILFIASAARLFELDAF